MYPADFTKQSLLDTETREMKFRNELPCENTMSGWDKEFNYVYKISFKYSDLGEKT